MIKKILWVLFEKGALTIIQFISLIVLSRLLKPEDYGIYGVMMVFIAISNMLVDSGLGGALVQKKDINNIDINTLFFANTVISIFLYMLLFFAAPYLEDFYAISDLTLYIRVLGISILIFAMSLVQNSLIIRNLQFRKSAIINIVASLASLFVAVLIAQKGLGVWALIYQVIVNSILVTILMWLTTKTKIGINISKDSFRYFWNFGSNVLGSNILDCIVTNVTTLLIPKIDSVGRSGMYFQASKISSIPISILSLSIDKFSFPILAKEPDSTSMLEKSRLINRNLLFLIIPVFPFLSYCSFPIIQIVLGEKWEEVAPYFSILVLSGAGLLIQVLYRNMIKANGNTRYLLNVETVKSIILFVSILTSAFWGIWAIIYCVLAMSIIGVLLWSACVKKVLGFSYRNQLYDILKPMASIVLVTITMMFINIDSHSYIRFLVVVLAMIGYILINYILRNSELLLLLHRVKNIKQK